MPVIVPGVLGDLRFAESRFKPPAAIGPGAGPWEDRGSSLVGYSFLLLLECIAATADFLTVLLAVNVVVDPPATGTNRTFKSTFYFWSAVSLHSASDVLIVPTGTKTGTK
jgi:hypothetical protein